MRGRAWRSRPTTESVESQRATLTELLLVDQPPAEEDPKETTTADNELLALARRYGVEHGDDGCRAAAGRGTTTPTP